MSKLNLDQGVPNSYSKADLSRVILAITGQLNGLSEGRIAARYNAQASVPSGGSVSYAVGDFVPDTNCTVGASVVSGLGVSYIRLGWVCTVPGTPGTFQEVRVLTGAGSAGGFPASAPITNSLTGNVTCSNTANYFTGPIVSQGSTGTWFVSGTVTLSPNASDVFSVKLWDGTTVIASARTGLAGVLGTVSLSGFIASPAGDLRISVRDETSTAGFIAFNSSGNSKDSTITAYRIA